MNQNRRFTAGTRRGRIAGRWIGALLLLTGMLGSLTARASGASPYLPLNLSPEIERKVERVLILAGQPVLTRPVAVDKILQALPKARRRDPALCAEVERYLDRYFRSTGVTHASLELAAASHNTTTMPNERGERLDSPWDVSAEAFYRPADHLLLTVGGVAYGGTDGRFNPDGTMASLGDEYLQLDLGYRDHWLSPLTDSSMLQSTEAPSMPSVTLSNQRPITGLGLQYELFLAQMSYSDHIVWQNGFTAGHPRLAGVHLGIEPVEGWALSANRTFQFGGGARPGSLGQFLRALYEPGKIDNATDPDQQFSNEQASVTSAYTFAGKTPFEAYVEYAGEDTFHGEAYRLHDTDLSAGLHFPDLMKRFDLVIEASEWQDQWYVHHIYQDGMTEDGYVTGQWGADWRTFSDAVGAHSLMLQLGWQRASGDAINLRYRTLQNQDYGAVEYRRAHMLTLEYSQPRNGYTRGLQLDAGSDSFGAGFARLAAFVRLDGGNQEGAAASIDNDADTDSDDADSGARFERFVDVGVSAARVGLDLGGFTAAQEAAAPQTTNVTSPHFGIGVRRAVSAHGDLGVRAEFDSFNGATVGLRLLDYRYRLGRHLAAGAFFGFSRYSAPTPAQGYYAGAGLQWRDLLPHWDLSLDYRYFDHLQRNKLLPSDPQNGDPVEWYTIQAPTLSVSYRF